MIGRYVLAAGRMLAVAGGAGMGGNPLAAMEYLNSAGGDPCPELLPEELMRNRVIVPPDIDVVVEPDAAPLPFSIGIRLGGQRLQGRFVDLLK
ncbi:MAG: hypothetical protein AAGG56_18490 [Pseudomonadota bacterium]